ncbi:MAG: M56 family metallopeptidase, partial [Brevundimonas sp.]|uniref:M56 family metallopeptidase n=1 Tax=Brevundimonas sp. TaxID=1871086 RepID=UPI002732E6C3
MIAALILSLALKSAVIAGAGLLCAKALARGASDRANILRATVCLLLALPLVALALPAWELALLPASVAAGPTVASAPLWQGEIGPVAGVAVSAAMPWPSPMGLVVALWLAGGALIVGRLVLGVLTLDRWTSEGQAVTCPAWRAALDRLSPGRRPRLVTSVRLTGPLSWGVPPGTILLDPASLSDPGAADAILAHELAHLRRGDWGFLVLSRLTLALFWFNPLVWMLHATLVARTEEAADAAAVSRVDRQTYAHALVRLASQPAANTALPWSSTAMAGDARSLKNRIDCLMTDHAPHARPLTVAVTVAALSLLATPLAALQVTQDPPPPA